MRVLVAGDRIGPVPCGDGLQIGRQQQSIDMPQRLAVLRALDDFGDIRPLGIGQQQGSVSPQSDPRRQRRHAAQLAGDVGRIGEHHGLDGLLTAELLLMGEGDGVLSAQVDVLHARQRRGQLVGLADEEDSSRAPFAEPTGEFCLLVGAAMHHVERRTQGPRQTRGLEQGAARMGRTHDHVIGLGEERSPQRQGWAVRPHQRRCGRLIETAPEVAHSRRVSANGDDAAGL